MNTVMALALVLYLGWTWWGTRRTPGARPLVWVSLLVVALLAPLVVFTLREAGMASHTLSPAYVWMWPVVAALSVAAAFWLRRRPAYSWPLLGIAPCGLAAYAAVLLLFELGVTPPLDIAP